MTAIVERSMFPEHGTRRTVAQLASYRPDVRFIAINRKGGAVRVYLIDLADLELEMEYDSNWHAWTVRLSKGPWQQICIFEPHSETSV